ncbi:hypothetical protein TVAG_042770 [Trichomonas vaginalis G3]|uniref:Uncharacterized protein n=1 Tax=Trichomonas vaginalis (strain ATCC PRA-98 / G3) TaxID=412133 RepID=A2FQ39_TRIV3|nr:hypothetical protein TVAGG3_1026060 [Trichomonas vaginalis G3]EAX92978.1 hypothetical protein TVAG_042770 [Trichomonas vaginalis G3]KAI5492504.1 hypothetical protein TVAGG3_1026060 [Trichomonas vaginalis G3]|eukprot:XP_001305908.1 hypothetical protein [Trichomonas vaginalis G3]
MNSRFLPGRDKEVKQGLDTVRKLVPVENAQENSARIRESIPSNWIYNEKYVNNVWEDLEQYTKKNIQSAYAEQNPFKQIDDSASKIRQIIATFESQDEEFILNFMNILGESDDFSGSSFDSDAIFFEARSRLQDMIDQHVDFTVREGKLLESMVLWYKLQKNMKIDDSDQFTVDEMKKYDIKRLQDTLDELNRMKEARAEEATSLHHDIVSNLRDKVNEYQTQLTQKELQLSQMQQESSRNLKNKRRSSRTPTRALQTDDEFQDQQRKILELNSQVSKLKQALMEVSQNAKPVEEAQEILNKIPDPLQSEQPTIDLSVAKELDFENRIKSLNEQLKSVKDDYKNTREQFMKSKQNELLLEKKLDAAERQKKSLESQQNTLQKKLDQLEASFNERLENAKNTNPKSIKDDDNSASEIIKKYEAKIQAMNETNQSMIKSIEESYNTKLKAQMQTITNALNNGDAKSAFEETTRQLNIQLEKAKVDAEKVVSEMKQKTSEQLMTMSKHYENLLRKKTHDMEAIRNSVDSEIKNRLFEIRLEYDEKTNQKILQEQGKYQTEITELKNGLLKEIDILQNKLTDVTHQKDAYKSILINSDLLESEEEEDMDEDKTKTDDDVLQNSLLALKEREIEQKVSEKYQILLKTQQELLMDSKKWELEQARIFLENKYDDYLQDFRVKIADAVHKIYDESPHDNVVLEKLLISVLDLVDNDKKFDKPKSEKRPGNEPTIPVHEVERKMNELTQKVVELSSENEILRKFASSKSDSKDVMAKIEEQSKKIGELTKENLDLQKEINVLSSKVNAPVVSHAATSREFPKLKVIDKETQTLDYKPNVTIKTDKINTNQYPSLSITTSQLFNLNSNNDDFSMHAECLHCHNVFGFEPGDVQHKLAMSSIISCPICRKMMTLQDNFDDKNGLSNLLLDETNLDNVINIEENDKKPPIQISDELNNFSVPPTQREKVELQIDLSHENHQSSHSTARRQSTNEENVSSGRRSSLADSGEIVPETPLINEIPQNEKREENQKPNTEEIKPQKIENVPDPQLQKLVENNTVLQKKLMLAAQALKDMERQYNERVSFMENKINEMQKDFIRQNQLAIQASKELPPTQEGNEQKKYTVNKIYSHVREIKSVMNFDINMPNPPPKSQEQMIDIAENALFVMKEKIDDKTKPVTVKGDLNGLHQKMTNFSLEFAGIKGTFKQFVKKTNEKNKELADQLKDYLLKFTKQKSKEVENLQKEKERLNKDIERLNQTIKERERFMNSLRDELDKTRNENDDLREEIQSSLTEVQKLQLSRGEKSQLFKIMQETELDREKHIDLLTEDVVSAKKEVNKMQNNMQSLENQNIQLKDQIITEIENPKNVKSSRSDKMSKIEEETKLDFVPSFVVFSTKMKMNNGFALVSKNEMKNKNYFNSQPLLIQTEDDSNVVSAKIQTPKHTTIKVLTRPNQSLRITTAKTVSRPLKNVFPRPISPNIQSTRDDDVVQFDTLIPLTVDDTSSSVIAYVTHYVKQNVPKNDRNKSLLLPTPIDTSEAKTAIVSSRSKGSIIKPPETNQAPQTIVVEKPATNRSKSPNDREANLEKRIKQLERVISDKSNEICTCNDKIHELNVFVFKIKQEIIKIARQKKKSDMMLESSKRQLSKAMDHLVERDRHISDLKKIISDFRKIAESLKQEKQISSSRTTYSGRDDIVLLNSLSYAKMADNEMRSLERWNLRRKKILDEERDKLMRTLRAIRLLDETPIKQDLVTVTSQRSPSKEKRTTVTPNAKEMIK